MTVQEKYLKIADDVIAAGPYKPVGIVAAYEAPKGFEMRNLAFLFIGVYSAYPPIIMNGIPVTCIFRTWKNGNGTAKTLGNI